MAGTFVLNARKAARDFLFVSESVTPFSNLATGFQLAMGTAFSDSANSGAGSFTALAGGSGYAAVDVTLEEVGEYMQIDAQADLGTWTGSSQAMTHWALISKSDSKLVAGGALTNARTLSNGSQIVADAGEIKVRVAAAA